MSVIDSLLNLIKSPWLSRCLLAMTLIAFTYYFSHKLDWRTFQQIHIQPQFLTLAFVVNIIYLLLYAGLWRLISVFCRIQLDWTQTLAFWCFSNFGKYFPIKIAGMGYRVMLYQQATQKSVVQISYACLVETLTCLAGGFVLSLILFAFVGSQLFPLQQVPILLLFGLALGLLLIPEVQKQIWKRIGSIFKQTKTIHQIDSKQAVLLTVLYSFSWLYLGFILYIQALALGAKLEWIHLFHFAFLYAFAGIAGMVSFFAPSGIGVREGLLMFGLSPFLPVYQALALTILARVMTSLVELIGILISWIYLEKLKTSAQKESNHHAKD